MRERPFWKRAITPTLVAASIGLTGAGAAHAESTSHQSTPPIHEKSGELNPIEVKTIDMIPGETYPLQKYSIVIAKGDIIANGKRLKNDKNSTIVFALNRGDAPVSVSKGGKAQTDIDPAFFKTVVKAQIADLDNKKQYVIVREQRGPIPGSKRSLMIAGLVVGMIGLYLGGNYVEEWNRKGGL